MKHRRTIQRIAVVLLILSLFCTMDLGINLLYNIEPSLHDNSYETCSLLQTVFGIFGDSLWSFERFFFAFCRSAWITFALLSVNLLLPLFAKKRS